jgi:hypothetical protein
MYHTVTIINQLNGHFEIHLFKLYSAKNVSTVLFALFMKRGLILGKSTIRNKLMECATTSTFFCSQNRGKPKQ